MLITASRIAGTRLTARSLLCATVFPLLTPLPTPVISAKATMGSGSSSKNSKGGAEEQQEDADFSSRPAAKRVRSDQDHSKGETKARENGEGKEAAGDEDKDEEWLSNPPFSVGADKDGWKTKWRSSCWCGKTAFVFNADPLQVKCCHCEDCQRLHGAPFQQAAVFKKDAVRLDSTPEWLGFLSAHGEVHPLSSTPTPLPRKTSCRACGSPLFDEGRNMVMAFPPCFEFARSSAELEKAHKHAEDKHPEGGDDGEHGAAGEAAKLNTTGPPEPFKIQKHIFYERRIMDVIDGLPKWRKHADESEQMGETQRP